MVAGGEGGGEEIVESFAKLAWNSWLTSPPHSHTLFLTSSTNRLSSLPLRQVVWFGFFNWTILRYSATIDKPVCNCGNQRRAEILVDLSIHRYLLWIRLWYSDQKGLSNVLFGIFKYSLPLLFITFRVCTVFVYIDKCKYSTVPHFILCCKLSNLNY